MDDAAGGVPKEKKEDKKRGRPPTAIQLGRLRTNSTGSIQDFLKRKREESDRYKAEEEIRQKFEKTRKIYRSPPKEGKQAETNNNKPEEEKNNDMATKEQMDSLVALLTEMRNDIKDIKKENGELREDIRKIREEQRTKDKEREENDKKTRERIERLEAQAKEAEMARRRVESREEAREKKEKRNNIVIKGLEKEGTYVTPRLVENFIEQKLSVQGTVIETFWNKHGNRGMGMIVAKLDSWETKQEIMKKKNLLANSEVYIDHDRTFKDRDIQRQIGEIAKAEEQNGNTVKKGFKKLTINDKQYEWKDGVGLQQTKFQDNRKGEDRR